MLKQKQDHVSKEVTLKIIQEILCSVGNLEMIKSHPTSEKLQRIANACLSKYVHVLCTSSCNHQPFIIGSCK